VRGGAAENLRLRNQLSGGRRQGSQKKKKKGIAKTCSERLVDRSSVSKLGIRRGSSEKKRETFILGRGGKVLIKRC